MDRSGSGVVRLAENPPFSRAEPDEVQSDRDEYWGIDETIIC